MQRYENFYLPVEMQPSAADARVKRSNVNGPFVWGKEIHWIENFSLSSRQSASRSFETVIRVPSSESPDTEEELLMIKRSEKMWNPGTRAKSVPKDAENDNYVSNDYEELIIQVRRRHSTFH